jgi:radical SAM protein
MPNAQNVILITASTPQTLLSLVWSQAISPIDAVSGRLAQDSAGGLMQPMHQIPARGGLNFDEAPFLAIWEVTQSCDLACKHCRAAAQPIAHPDQLSTEEGKRVIDQIAEMKIPIFVFTGGDPMKRPDVYELIRYSAEKGVKVAVTPSATPLLTREAIFKMKEAGVVRLGISLDGSTPEIHDKFRGLPGAWARTIQAVQWAGEAGLPIQVHTTISRHNADDLDNLCNLFEKLAIVMWNVFFLVPVGRGQLGDLLSGEEFEHVFGKIYELSHRVSFQIKTTEAMHYRRYLLQHNLEEKKMSHGHPGHPGAAQEYEPGAPQADAGTRTHTWATRRVNDGKGFMFISHVGNVYPSGFLPIHAGNVRETPLAEIYREAPIFKALRDTSKLEGKCGACEFKEICGGSRARAYALTGDPLAAEPCCIYQPRNWKPSTESEHSAFCQPEMASPLVTL